MLGRQRVCVCARKRNAESFPTHSDPVPSKIVCHAFDCTLHIWQLADVVKYSDRHGEVCWQISKTNHEFVWLLPRLESTLATLVGAKLNSPINISHLSPPLRNLFVTS